MRILLTGGASGLGEAITHRLAAHDLVITFHRSGERARELATRYPNVVARPLDFGDAAGVAAFLDDLGPVDVLINNAVGGLARKHAHKLTGEGLQASFALNVAPVVELTSHVIVGMRKQRHGRIVTVLSEGLLGAPPLGLAEYLANKAYLASLARSWGTENAAYGISSSCVLPSFMATGLNQDLDPRAVEQIVAASPAARLLEADEAAEVVAFLATCQASITGAEIVVRPARRP